VQEKIELVVIGFLIVYFPVVEIAIVLQIDTPIIDNLEASAHVRTDFNLCRIRKKKIFTCDSFTFARVEI